MTDVDGLGAGGGQLFLVTDNANSNGGLHTLFNLSTGEFSQPLESPYPAPAGSPLAPNPSAAGAYTPNIPAPGTVALVSLAGLAGAAEAVLLRLPCGEAGHRRLVSLY